MRRGTISRKIRALIRRNKFLDTDQGWSGSLKLFRGPCGDTIQNCSNGPCRATQAIRPQWNSMIGSVPPIWSKHNKPSSWTLQSRSKTTSPTASRSAGIVVAIPGPPTARTDFPPIWKRLKAKSRGLEAFCTAGGRSGKLTLAVVARIQSRRSTLSVWLIGWFLRSIVKARTWPSKSTRASFQTIGPWLWRLAA